MPKHSLVLGLAAVLILPFAFSQPNRIAGRITAGQRFRLRGNVHPRATPENDQGAVDPNLTLSRVTLLLQPTASQKAALAQLLADQQNPASQNYHHWLTPEEYADRFGVSQSDVDQITAWLRTQNLTVVEIARGRDWIAVSGTASAFEQAFDTPIHRYLVRGELHFANASEPSLPGALRGIVAGIHGLNDFRLKPASRSRAGVSGASLPQYNNANLCGHCLAPDDVATIYNINPLYNSGLNGTGQKIAVVGQTQIRTDDIDQYRGFFKLAAASPQVVLVPGQTDPGVVNGDLGEADLDLEMAGVVARNATVIYVYAPDVTTSAQYVIDQNLAPVLSMSYGDCEAAYTSSDSAQLQAMAQRANAQGITWFAPSGDDGATDCASDTFPGAKSAASVDLPAGIPEVTGVGGTEFAEGAGNYWNANNNSNNASALSYIPEISWNDTATDGSPSASGGGKSARFSKPSWQTGAGVPSDNARAVPDISISASADHDGYVVFTSDPTACGKNNRAAPTLCEVVFGGTSVGPPLFAGLAAVLNQAAVSKGLQSNPGLGNINPALYTLAASSPSAFHDITTGNNIINVTCAPTDRNCTSGSVGYNAASGYDLVTGLGTVDAGAFVNAWISGATQGSPPNNSLPTITAFGNGASYTQVDAPGMILTIYGSQLASTTALTSSVPLPAQMAGVTVTINGVPAPLWYVSENQLNVQIPYETPVDTSVTLTVVNNGQSATASFTAAAAAPGIFMDQQGAPVPSTSGSPGQVLTMYATGVGAVSPSVADGDAPAAGTPLNALPHPQQAATVTVGGATAPIQFIGIPPGVAGVVQINYQVPANLTPGPHPVVLTVGGIPSPPVTLTVTP